MLYAMYQARSDLLEPLRSFSQFVSQSLESQESAVTDNLMVRNVIAACDLFAKTKLSYESPPFAIDEVLDWQPACARNRRARAVDALRLLAEIPQRVDVAQTQSAGGRAFVRPLCHFAARNR